MAVGAHDGVVFRRPANGFPIWQVGKGSAVVRLDVADSEFAIDVAENEIADLTCTTVGFLGFKRSRDRSSLG